MKKERNRRKRYREGAGKRKEGAGMEGGGEKDVNNYHANIVRFTILKLFEM